MTRILWIIGLSFALFVFGGWTVVIAFAGFRHRHLNQRGLMMLVGNAYTAWITFWYLQQKLAERRPTVNLPADSDRSANAKR